MTAMSMKLGPALKICAKIDTMRCDVKEKQEQWYSWKYDGSAISKLAGTQQLVGTLTCCLASC